MNILKTTLFAAIASTFAFAATASTIGFNQITSNGSTGGSSQLSADLTDGGDGVLIDFNVTAGANANINVTEVYFDDKTPLFTPPPEVVSQSGASFTAGSASPGNLPGGGDLTPVFQTTAQLLADATGASVDGLTIGDDLVLKLVYAGSYGFADVIAALNNGQLRIGLHVRSLSGFCDGGQTEDGCSEGFVNGEIPLPAAGWMMIAGIGGLAALKRKKRAA